MPSIPSQAPIQQSPRPANALAQATHPLTSAYVSSLEKLSAVDVEAVFSSCSTRITLGSTVLPEIRTVPLYIPLSPDLTHPAEVICAQAVAAHLSSKCGRAVELSELEGLFLYLWSEDDPDGRALDDYLGDSSRTLQALLLEMRNLEGHAESLVSPESLAFVGQRFEFLGNR